MIDFDDAFARSYPGHTFSNSTEFEIWSARWCFRCLREAPFRSGLTCYRCPLVGVALFGRVPAEWLEDPIDDTPAGRFHCAAFRDIGGGSRTPPRPRPPDPEQYPLFGATHHEPS